MTYSLSTNKPQKKFTKNFTLYHMCLLAIIIEGYVVLASEIIAIRQLISFVGSDTPIVAIIISAVLLPMAFGYYNGGQLYKKLSQKNFTVQIRDILIRNATIAAVFLSLALSHIVLSIFFSKIGDIGIESRIAKTFIYSIIFLVTPVYLLAQTTPLISNYFKKHNLSQTAGKMLFSSTVGSFLGAILTSLLLMHLIGVNNTVITTILALSFLVVMLSRKLVSFQTITVLIVSIFVLALNNNYTIGKFGIVSNNQYSTIEVVDVPEEREFESRLLKINNSESSKFTIDPSKQFPYLKYVEKFVLSKLPQDRINNILVIGAGGFSVGTQDTTNNYVYIDIDDSLKEVSEKYFLKHKLSDNKKFVPEPARFFLKRDTEKYDVIILDAYTNIHSIPSQLVTKEYFLDVQKRLNDKGIMIANIISKHNFSDEWSVKIDNTIRSVFSSVNRIPVHTWGPWEDNDSNVIYISYNASKPSQKIYTDNKNSHFLDK
ncbi:MAG: fused MFS/spermidine synthase [Rickettsiales bacterium]|nr:fused MFS/spermidine synthase [Pseudomonadota bacterium]MDA0965869.1 fused MFS/spermidine synthase [Pseudomonadota bacterium]MDG4542661.1 fused MFS/spermidine synthase [Rickettsiales bacterium]MDG4545165.1 fused MFS/spermidine synthase [Rickettsiales bacterium]MDG4547288.1 fused MFS/spermidine synthase [Rickettsiales bacterium]